MTRLGKLGALVVLAGLFTCFYAPAAELNPVQAHPAGEAESARFIVVFRETAQNRVVKRIRMQGGSRTAQFSQAQTSAADASGLIARLQLSGVRAQQLTPSMHVLQFDAPLRGAAVGIALKALRADASIAFADIDQRRYAHALPTDPLFAPSSGASGQWFMLAPTSADPAAIDAVGAWDLATGSTGVVIADVDSGYRFDHPDLLRAGLGGKLLPGYDFVGADLNSINGKSLGTYLIANDGDGWDPDPSDPGDWINASDQSNSLFPSSRCSVSNSSWHGTRVAGVLGALTNNGTGIAGVSWNSYILPVRALGKCGGYDSDIMTGIQWAAGLSVTGVPDNPYPADIVNLSLGGDGSCSSSYQSLITKLAGMGVLVVASAGNESGPVDSPGNCNGVLAVAGLRNVGTKVGYSSLGAQVGISAPAGNCVVTNTCLRPIDTTSNDGTTVPADNIYTDQANPSLGTSFSAPIVSGVAALMRSVNGNLTPAQLIARIQSSATPFPGNSSQPPLPVCPATSTSGECSCVPGQCGAGMLNAFSAVKAAQRPIAAVSFPAHWNAGATVTVNAGPSLAACNQSIASYQWTRTGGVAITGGAAAATVSASASGAAAGTLVLTVTDGAGSTDTATVSVTSAGAASSTAPVSAGSAAAACPTALALNVLSPTVALAFAPATVDTDAVSTLTITFSNGNPFVLTQSQFAGTLPAGLDVSGSATTTCTGHDLSLSGTAGNLTLSGANIPAQGSCRISVGVKSSTAGSYLDTVGVDALGTGPAGGNAVAAQGTLNVTAAAPSDGTTTSPAVSSGGSGGGGGEMDWLDMMLLAGILLVCRSHLGRGGRPRP